MSILRQLNATRPSQNDNPNVDIAKIHDTTLPGSSNEVATKIFAYIQQHPSFQLNQMANDIRCDLGRIRETVNVLIFFNFVTYEKTKPRLYKWCSQVPRENPIDIQSVLTRILQTQQNVPSDTLSINAIADLDII